MALGQNDRRNPRASQLAPHHSRLDETQGYPRPTVGTSYHCGYRGVVHHPSDQVPYHWQSRPQPQAHPQQFAAGNGQGHYRTGTYDDPRNTYYASDSSQAHAQQPNWTQQPFMWSTPETYGMYSGPGQAAHPRAPISNTGRQGYGAEVNGARGNQHEGRAAPDPYTNVQPPPVDRRNGPEGPGGNTDGRNTNRQTVYRQNQNLGVVSSNNVISGQGGEEETLDTRYRKQREPRRFFTVGKVFAILWHENAGRNGTVITSPGPFTTGPFGQPIYSTIRRMVVVRELEQCAWCLPITTYSGQGVAKQGVNPQDHAVIHMRHTEPFNNPPEPRITKEPLEVKPAAHDQKLDKMSRLNFGRVYTVEHNVKVMPVGKISERSMPKLRGYARDSFSCV